MAVFLEPDESGNYHCPINCGLKSTLVNTVRKHCADKHEMKVTTVRRQTKEERTARQRERMRTLRHSGKIAKQDRKKARRQHAALTRAPLTTLDADERGVHLAKDPLVKYAPSLIPGAGNGLFACIPLLKGDVVTRYDGRVCEKEPSDPRYAIAFTGGGLFLDGIREPKKGRGLASFVNKESRRAGLKRKNCEIVQVGMLHYLEMIKDVNLGDELYTTYSKQYRM